MEEPSFHFEKRLILNVNSVARLGATVSDSDAPGQRMFVPTAVSSSIISCQIAVSARHGVLTTQRVEGWWAPGNDDGVLRPPQHLTRVYTC